VGEKKKRNKYTLKERNKINIFAGTDNNNNLRIAASLLIAK